LSVVCGEFLVGNPKFTCTYGALRENQPDMIRFVCRFVVLAVVCGFSLAAGAAPRAEHVFIISFDGGSPAAIRQSQMPVLQKLVKQGACTWTAQTIKPPITLPSHTSMLTGVRPDKHKITWNSWQPTNGVVGVPTVFTAAKQAGFTTAMFVGKEKFRHLIQPGTVDEFCFNRAASKTVTKRDGDGSPKKKEGNVSAKDVAANAADYIISHKPNLCFIHFADPDGAGHKFGWGSPEQIKVFGEVDAALGTVLEAICKAKLTKRSVIIISADHGGHDKGHGKDIPEDMTIPWIVWGKGVKKGFKITEPVGTCDTAATALWLLGLQPISPLHGAVVTSAFK
jgi:predicted AlkP superfamily pyrophosphatase or phosphodiesterase